MERHTKSVLTEIKKVQAKNIHGLCSLSEAFWGVFLVKTKNRHNTPLIDEMRVDGRKITFLKKRHFSVPDKFINHVGVASMLVIESENESLVGSILYRDEKNQLLMRCADPIIDSVSELGQSPDINYQNNAQMLKDYLYENYTSEALLSLKPLNLYYNIFTS